MPNYVCNRFIQTRPSWPDERWKRVAAIVESAGKSAFIAQQKFATLQLGDSKSDSDRFEKALIMSTHRRIEDLRSDTIACLYESIDFV